jgi:hypothetical protein
MRPKKVLCVSPVAVCEKAEDPGNVLGATGFQAKSAEFGLFASVHLVKGTMSCIKGVRRVRHGLHKVLSRISDTTSWLRRVRSTTSTITSSVGLISFS